MLVQITVKEGREAAFEELARKMYDASHADEDRLLRYEYWRGAEPRTYYTLGAFEDFRAFLDHQASDHHETAGPALRDVIDDLRLEWVDPVGGASPLPPTDHQDTPADANELKRSYAERFAVRPPAWWLTLRGD